MSETTFRITGRIVDRTTQAGIPGIRVEAWDRDLFFDDLVGCVEGNDADGRFLIAFRERHFKELFQRRPDVYFKLFQAGAAIPADKIALEVTLPDDSPLTGRGDEVFWRLAETTS